MSALLLAHERSRFAICQCELKAPTDRSIPRRLVLRALEAGECLSAFKNAVSVTNMVLEQKKFAHAKKTWTNRRQKV